MNWQLLAVTLVGTILVMASACVFNNYIDRNIDIKMERTKSRALVIGKISTPNALIFGTILGLIGITLLLVFVNALTAIIGVLAFVDYVIIYGIFKRKSVHGTLIGSIAGALPPVAGYTAVTNSLDIAALLLFVVLVCWQMPHFYSIGIYRLKDYKAAGIPVHPIKKGLRATKIQIFGYILLFIASACLFFAYNYAGWVYLVCMLLVGVVWLNKAYLGFRTDDDSSWARQMFGYSLKALLSFSVLISLSSFLP